MHCPCRIENISACGTLVRLKDSTCDPLQVGDGCLLTIYTNTDQETPAMQVETQVIHHAFTLVGLKFIELNSEKISSLNRLIGGIAAAR